MGNVLAADYYRILVLQQPPGDQARYARALLQLPALPWEIEGETEVTEAAVRALVLDNPDIRMRSADETIARYRELRAIGGRLATEVLEIAGATVIMESARALGFMHGNTLVLDNEDEMAYILDYALYANPHQRDRYLQAYLDAHPVLDAESRLVLEAMFQARYCLLQCKAIIPEMGLQVADLLHGEQFTLVDQMLGKTGAVGMMLATHVVAPDGIHMTTGAALPIFDPAIARRVLTLLEPYLGSAKRSFNAKNQHGTLTTRIVTTLLAAGTLQQIAFAQPGESPEQAMARLQVNQKAPPLLLPPESWPQRSLPLR